MKHIFLLSIMFSFAMSSSAQDHRGWFKLDSKWKKAPFAFVWTEKGKVAVKQSEVTVDAYLWFLERVSKDSSDEYVKKLIPSQECVLFPYVKADQIGMKMEYEDGEDWPISWIDEEKFKKDFNYPMQKSVKGFDDNYFNPYSKPITGISYEQAMEYAKWCTLYCNSFLKGPQKQIMLFRLPTPEEFSAVSKKGMESCYDPNTPIGAQNIKSMQECKNQKGCALCHCAGKDTCKENLNTSKNLGDGLYSAPCYFPNCLGIYNMQGNASEMTSEKGVAKGGSYLNFAKDCSWDAVQKYDKPEKWLGLRLFAEVVPVDGKNVYYNSEGKLIVR
jgi:formylglycine-generating enzyme required for sulfatase activity